MRYQRKYLSLVSYDEKLYAIGGYNSTGELSSVETFKSNNLDSDKWQPSKPLNIKRYSMGSTVIDNKIYVCGGVNNGKVIKSCEIFSSKTNSWQFTRPMMLARSNFQLIANNGFIYAIGGSGTLYSVERYSIKTKQWSFIPNTNYPRDSFGATVFLNNIYICGGSSSEKICEKYDTDRNTWITISSFINPRYYFQIITFNDKIFALGSHQSTYSSSVEIYDYKSDQWFLSDSLPSAVYDHASSKPLISVSPLKTAALGRVAELGEFYDARTDNFIGINLFSDKVPGSLVSSTDNAYTNMKFTMANILYDKFYKLDVDASLKLSFMAGLVTIELGSLYVNINAVLLHIYDDESVMNITDTNYSNITGYSLFELFGGILPDIEPRKT
ncbi:kelch-like protein 18 [Oppia nitens]|uniref:kelch-like protein 18 n=1 Tax=Oppia nitens TaxID=1686743 RepID=UPI0023DA951C|nr:kelch-like protein 18 [Oppia nitens]